MLKRDRHVRRTGTDYKHGFLALLPQGQAWPRGEESLLVKVVQGLCEYWGFVDRRAADLLEQESDPRITLELLPDWERNWGLPDPCYEAPQTIGERQQALIMRMTMLGGASREFFIDVAAQIGYTITITEYRVWVVGLDQCGDSRVFGELPPDPMRNEWGQPIMNARGDVPVADGELSGWPHYGIGPPANRFYWTVHVDDAKLIWFRVGAGGGQTGIDPHLRIGTADDLECLLNRWKPAHTEIIFDYSGIAPPNLAFAAEPVAENATLGTVVGTFFIENKFTGTPIFSLTDDAGGRFAIVGDNLTVAGALDFETAASHTILAAVTGIDPPLEDNFPFIIEVMNVAEPEWVTVFGHGHDFISPGWSGYNLRQGLLAGFFTHSGTKIRLTLNAAPAEGVKVSGMYAGHASAAAQYNFDGTQVQIKVGGVAAFTIPAGGTVVTDPIDYPFDKKKNFLLSAHFDSAANDTPTGSQHASGATIWHKVSASEAANTTITGYATTNSNLRFISKIEVWTPIL